MGEGKQSQPGVCSPEAKGILESSSYFLLSEDAQALVIKWASASPEERVLHFDSDLKSAILNRPLLQHEWDAGKVFLNKLNPAAFPIKAKDKRYQAELDVDECKLAMLYYKVSMFAERSKETKNLPLMLEHKVYLEYIARVLEALREARRESEAGAKPSPLNMPATVGDKAKPMRYFGMLYIAPAITKAVTAMTLDGVANWHAVPASFNDLRLYLVWANALAQCICDMIAKSVQVTLTVTRAFLGDLAFLTGSLGFILYFTTFGIAASIGLQNTLDLKGTYFEDWGITEKMRALDLRWDERFKAQWDERKFLILNNAVWGLVNFVCFFWLVGHNVFGYWGNVLTGLLLLADLALVCWQFMEAETEHNKTLAFYDKGIEELALRIGALEDQNNPEKQSLMARLQVERRELQKAKANVERDWKYHVKKHELNLMYGVGVMIGFALLCSFFFPPALIVPFTGMILALVGAAMCFGLGVAFKALSGQVIMQKETEISDLSSQDYGVSLQIFKEVSKDLKPLLEKLKAQETLEPQEQIKFEELQTESKLLYLSMKKAMTTKVYQSQAVEYQKAQVICNFLIDLILPTLFLLAFVFMPLGVGMPIFAVGLVVLFYANWQVAEMAPEGKKPEMFARLDNFCDWLLAREKPEEKGLEQFDENEYKKVCDKVNENKDPAELLREQVERKTPPELPVGDICPEGAK